MKLTYVLIASLCILHSTFTNAYDIAHFYRATPFWSEPRLEKPWLGSFDVTFFGRSTKEARDKNGDTTTLLNIYGLHNMHLLGENVPNKDLTTPEDVTLTLLSLIPRRDDFGQLKYSGDFHLFEVTLDFVQNFCNGFFVQAHVPIRKMELKSVTFADQSPTGGTLPNINDPIWQSFLNQFDAILTRYGITSTDGFCTTDVGDVTLALGWTQNYQETEHIDYVDTSFRIGVLVPSGREKNEDIAFDIPSGYNGHVAGILAFDAAIGAYDWLTLGGHFHVLIFGDKKKQIRMKTDNEQSGFIKLAKGNATIDKGTLWDAGLFIKADHLVSGFSLLFGYTFASKNKDNIIPVDTTTFSPSVANSDEQFEEWKMHTLHFLTEFDFTRECWRVGPRISFFYNHHVGGKRIFKNNTVGGAVGVDVAWCF